MKKRFLNIVAGCLMLASCQKLDIPPVNILSDQDVFTSEAGVNAYLAQVYRKLPIEDFTYRPDGRNDGVGNAGFNLHHEWEHFYCEAAADGEMVGPYGGVDIAGGFGYWPYSSIRDVNYFLQTLPKYSSYFTPDKVSSLLGEVHFLRAYYYFALAKRYGGIPIIKTVQNYPQQTIEELQVPRNTEEEVWNFIADDLDTAYQMMGETSVKERANKYVAMALKSRAMVYAGSIARYGSQVFVDGDARSQGFVGISADKAAGYYQKAVDAAKTLEGHYALYRGKTDKTENYVNIFLDPASGENILIRSFYAGDPERNHSFDATFSPNSDMNLMSSGGLSRAYPTLEFVQNFNSFDFVTNADGTPRRYDNQGDITQGLEPRLRGTVYFPGDVLRGEKYDVQAGVYTSFSGTAADEVAKPVGNRSFITSGDHKTLRPNGRTVIGKAGMYPPAFGNDNNTRTGFYVRKYIDPTKSIAATNLFTSTTPWIELRYAEVLLNRAEADIELNQTSDALQCINDLRDRAGAPLATSADMTVATYRNERAKELAFENHYWWDIKRWRTADQLLNNTHFHGLMPYYVESENKYIFLKELELFNRNYYFDKKFYYEAMPGGELATNPNLYPNNPGY